MYMKDVDVIDIQAEGNDRDESDMDEVSDVVMMKTKITTISASMFPQPRRSYNQCDLSSIYL